MNNLASQNNKIRLEKIEFESQPGAGITAMKPLAKYAEDKMAGGALAAAQQPSNERIHNLFLAHLLKPREWSA